MKVRNILFIAIMSMLCFNFSACNYPKEDTVIIEQPKEQSDKSKVEENSATENSIIEDSVKAESWIWVDVSGAVKIPGVYRMKQGARVFEAIQEAGGFLENADTAGINQASVLSDGEKLQIYTKEEAQQMEKSPKSFSDSQNNIENNGKVNINTADLIELQKIPGVGEKKAQSIMEYREKNGKFQSIEQLQEVSGIKGKTFEKIKDYITVK